MSRAQAFFDKAEAQALARGSTAITDRLEHLEHVMASLADHPVVGEAVAEAKAVAAEKAEAKAVAAEAQRKAAEDAAKAEQIAALKAQLAQLGVEGFSPEAVAASLAPQGDST